jgi:hypothetical protein
MNGNHVLTLSSDKLCGHVGHRPEGVCREYNSQEEGGSLEPHHPIHPWHFPSWSHYSHSVHMNAGTDSHVTALPKRLSMDTIPDLYSGGPQDRFL